MRLGAVLGGLMLLSDLDVAAPSEVARLCGMTESGRCARGVYAGPCPVCLAERAHTRSRVDRRAAVLIRARGAAVCCACGVSWSRGDLLALARYGVVWRDLDAVQRAACLDAPVPAVAPPERPPQYLPPEVWERIVWACDFARRDQECVAWARGRGLVLPGDALVAPAQATEDLPFWTEKGLWLPDVGARLVLPCYDGMGRPRGVRLRNVRPKPLIKEQAIRGFAATGLVYAPPDVRAAWARGEKSPRPCVLVEGGPDRWAGSVAWPERAVIGLFSGSWGAGETWLRGLHEDSVFVHQEDPPDKHGVRKGQQYAQKFAALAPWVRLMGVSQVWEVAGQPWVEGNDLALLAERFRVPGWAEVAEP